MRLERKERLGGPCVPCLPESSGSILQAVTEHREWVNGRTNTPSVMDI